MAVEYVDAGQAVGNSTLAKIVGEAPPVTDGLTYERILNARSEPQNWLTYYGAYDGQRYSPLDQINTENVKRLVPAWVFQAGTTGLIAGASTYSFEATPIVVDGVMFCTGWDGWLWAIDAKTGVEIWRYKHAVPFDVSLCCGNVNRGCAVAKGKVFFVTANAHVIALDATNGKRVWDRTYGDVRAGESATCAPLVVKNLVIVGSSGGEFGVRGHLDAFDVDSGEHQWRCYMVPKPGEPGSETWPADGEAWQRGGANCWLTGTFDPETNLLYWGTGNPAPDFDGEVREGDNLYTDSVVAVDVDSGQIRWHYQCTPHDVWDYDSIAECILFESEGRKLLGHFDKNGYFFVLDRTNGQLVQITPFVDRIDWGNISRDGMVTASKYPDKEGEPVDFYPGPAGAKEWPHATYSRSTGLLYTPVVEVCARFKRGPTVYREGLYYLGGEADARPHDQWGEVKAFDPATGRQVWAWRSPHPVVASLLSTAGDVVFVGEANGFFNALDARTGAVLWRFNTGNGIHSNPVTYSVRGKQYVAVPNGWGGWIDGYAPELFGARRGTALHVFALP